VGVEPGCELEQRLLRDGGALAPASVAHLPCDVRAPCLRKKARPLFLSPSGWNRPRVTRTKSIDIRRSLR
jgi:hypothetical protein